MKNNGRCVSGCSHGYEGPTCQGNAVCALNATLCLHYGLLNKRCHVFQMCSLKT